MFISIKQDTKCFSLTLEYNTVNTLINTLIQRIDMKCGDEEERFFLTGTVSKRIFVT